jgi:hypothetical protein
LIEMLTVDQVGLIMDKAIEEDLLQRHLQVADAARATLGLPILEYTVTDTPLQVPSLLSRSTLVLLFERFDAGLAFLMLFACVFSCHVIS